MLDAGTWNGGYVGDSYASAEVICTGSGNSSNSGYWDSIIEDDWNNLLGSGSSGECTGSGYWDGTRYWESWEEWYYYTGGSTGGGGGVGSEPTSTGGGGRNTSGGSTTNGNTANGVDITNAKHFTFNTTSNSTFTSQLSTILKSNKIIANLLSFFDKGYVHMTFDLEELKPGTGAETRRFSSESYHIRFNSNMIDGDGWQEIFSGDSAEFDWSQVHTKNEALVVILAHEAMHANHWARYEAAMRAANNDSEVAVEDLKNDGYSDDFINIFFEKGGDVKWEARSVIESQPMEDYIRDHNCPTLTKALEEYRREYGN